LAGKTSKDNIRDFSKFYKTGYFCPIMELDFYTEISHIGNMRDSERTELLKRYSRKYVLVEDSIHEGLIGGELEFDEATPRVYNLTKNGVCEEFRAIRLERMIVPKWAR
jgi:hypothetical protein